MSTIKKLDVLGYSLENNLFEGGYILRVEYQKGGDPKVQNVFYQDSLVSQKELKYLESKIEAKESDLKNNLPEITDDILERDCEILLKVCRIQNSQN